MQDDQVRYWQDVTDNYRQMSDGELLELAEKPEDLTDVAQQVLRDEMRRRKLSKSEAQATPPASGKKNATINWEPISYRREFAESDPEESDDARDYTWKTQLCDCETRMQAMQLAEALRRAGIDSWIQAPRGGSDPFDLTYPRMYVAADQLEEAQAVASQPIPQDIIDDLMEAQTAPIEFEVPRCPKCGALDPVLESADPVNAWSCEACHAEWTDPEPTHDEDAGPKPSAG